MIKRKHWKWRGQAGHFICAYRCSFRLCTDVGNVRISTVGAMYIGERPKMEYVSGNGHYETMVFALADGKVSDWGETLDAQWLVHKDDPYASDALAEEMHLAMCLKWAARNGC